MPAKMTGGQYYLTVLRQLIGFPTVSAEMVSLSSMNAYRDFLGKVIADATTH